jgi:HAE1 family hydrophobic/amphiphilic exporter-1
MNIILQELGITICITLIASLLISQTLIPLAATKLLKPPKKKQTTPIMDKIQSGYSRILNFTLKHRWLAVVSGVGFLASTLYPVNEINFNFDTAPTEMFVGIKVNISAAVSLKVKEDMMTDIENALTPYKKELNVKSIYSWWSEGNSIVRLYMKQGFQNEEQMNKVRRQLPKLLPELAGVKLQVQDNGPFWRRNSGKRVAVRLEGPDSEGLSKLGDKALLLIQDIPGLYDFYTSGEGGKLELYSVLDRQKMESYGVSGKQSASVVEMTFRGKRLNRFKGENGEVEMNLHLGDDQDTSLNDMKNLYINKNDGSRITLDSISKFETRKGPRRINRQNKVSSIFIGARFDTGKKKELQQQLISRLNDMTLPVGYKWNFETRTQEAEESQKDFVLNLMLALGLIFAVMASLFESMRQALALMISLPFALAGAFWTLYAFGVDFDQPASVAILLLLGIVVNNGIVMIEHINLYRREGMERYPAMIRGGKERLRPIIMTALTTLVGLVPIAIQKPALDGVYYYSMAYVIMGGLLFSTVLTTVFLPATIALIEDAGSWIAIKIKKISFRPQLLSLQNK